MVMRAKYPGKCRKCGGEIKLGDEIDCQKGRGASHVTCLDQEAEPENAIRLSGGSGYGCRGWCEGQVLQNKDRYRGSACERARRPMAEADADCPLDGPEYLYVLSAGQRYIRDDGMSFGVGAEQGYVYWAVCRAATDDEARPVKASIEAADRRRAANERLRTIAHNIRETGTRPEGDNVPEGDRLADTQNIYGGGDWFVVARDRIWYVRNNGADGDDWSRNNVQTQGAGAIGWYVPYDADLAKLLRDLAATADRQPSTPRLGDPPC